MAATVRIVTVPYHLGRFAEGMGAGPDHLLAAGVVPRLRDAGLRVEVSTVEVDEPFEHEVGAAFAVQRALAEQVREAVAAEAFPLVLGGNCACTWGAVAGSPAGTGVVWFDAHADINTPETTTSGFLDGMALATLLGRCWTRMADALPGLAPLRPEQAVLVGARSLDDGERDMLDGTGVVTVAPTTLTEDLAPALARLRGSVEAVHVHLDLDVIDPSDGVANAFAVDGGPPLDALRAAIAAIPDHVPVRSAGVSSYDPAGDLDGRAAASALVLIDALAGLAGPR